MADRVLLRGYISERNTIQEFQLPPGVRRVYAQIERSLGEIDVGWIRQEVEDGTAHRITPEEPWDSGFHERDTGPLYFKSETKGLYLRLDVLRVSRGTDTGGGGGGPKEFCAIFSPEPNKVPVNTDLGGVWPQPPRDFGWGHLANWPDHRAAILGNVSNDVETTPQLTPLTSLLFANAWVRKSEEIPSTATITKIIFRLLGQKVPDPINLNEHDVKLTRISLIKAGEALTYDYTEDFANANPFWKENGPHWVEYEPKDDPLWGTSWSPSDFAVGSNINPNVLVTTIQQGSPDKNEKQRVILAGPPTGGTYTLTFAGQETGANGYNAIPADVQSGLEALSNIDPGDVEVTGTATDYTVEFKGQYALVDVPRLEGNGFSLTGVAGSDVQTIQESSTTKQNTIYGMILLNESSSSTAHCRFSLTRIANNGTHLAATDTNSAGFWFKDGTLDQVRLKLETLYGAGNVVVTRGVTTNYLNGRNYRYLRWELIGEHEGKDMRRHGFQLGTTRDWVVTGATGGFCDRVFAPDGVDSFDGIPSWCPFGLTVNTTCGVIQVGAELPGAVNEKQRIRITGNPQAGSFTIGFQGQTTAAITWKPSTTNIKTALEALSNINTVTVTAAGFNEWDVEFQGVWTGRDVELMTINTASLTGGNVSIHTSQAAATGVNEIQTIQLSGGTSAGEWGLVWDPGGGDQTTADIARNALPSAVKTALEGLAGISAGDVTVEGSAGDLYTIEFKSTYAKTNVNQLKPKSGFDTGLFGALFAASLEATNPAEKGQVLLEIYDAELQVCYTQ